MNRDQVKGRTRQVKGIVREIGGKLSRDKLMEKRGGAQKIGGQIQAGYGDFKEDTWGYDDIENDIRGYGDSQDDPQKSG